VTGYLFSVANRKSNVTDLFCPPVGLLCRMQRTASQTVLFSREFMIASDFAALLLSLRNLSSLFPKTIVFCKWQMLHDSVIAYLLHVCVTKTQYITHLFRRKPHALCIRK